MKIILSFLFSFCLLTFLNAQQKYGYKEGYRFIENARRSFDKGELKQSQSFLEKARQSSYGFCGNAYASAHADIDFIQAQIFNKQKKYDEALAVLDSCGGCIFGANCDTRDSLKIRTLLLKYGDEKVKKAFKNVESTNRIWTNENCCIYLTELSYNFCFWDLDSYTTLMINGEVLIKKEESFYENAKTKAFYQLIK